MRAALLILLMVVAGSSLYRHGDALGASKGYIGTLLGTGGVEGARPQALNPIDGIYGGHCTRRPRIYQ